MATTEDTRAIAVIGLPGVQSLDVVGPCEVFAVANQHNRQRTGYRVILGTPDGRSLVTHAGLEMGPATALTQMPDDIDTIVIAGGSEAAIRTAIAASDLIPWIQDRALRTRRIASVCTGAFVLAAAGLLDGKRATTHWNNCAELQALFPAIRVEPDAIFVSEPPFHSSAGVSAGIDLCLSLVEADLGAQTSLAVARELVLFLRRPGGQSQFSAALDIQVSGEGRLHRLITELLEEPTGDLSVPAMASRVGMSERSFSRNFRRDTGVSPGRFIEMARLGRAKALLETSDWTIERISDCAGFGSTDGLHRAFSKHLAITPAQYRSRFCTSFRADDGTDCSQGPDES